MYLFFIDETEKTKSKDRKYFFILCGVIIDGDKLIFTNEQLREIAEEYGITSLKELRKGNARFSKRQKIEATTSISRILSEADVKILSVIIGHYTLSEAEDIDAYFGALTFLIERYYINVGYGNVGLVILDNQDEKKQRQLRNSFAEYVTQNRHYMFGKEKEYFRKRIEPSLLFATDDTSFLLQATDLIATSLNTAVWKHHTGEPYIKIEELPNADDHLAIYWPMFVSKSDGSVTGYGVKHWN